MTYNDDQLMTDYDRKMQAQFTSTLRLAIETKELYPKPKYGNKDYEKRSKKIYKEFAKSILMTRTVRDKMLMAGSFINAYIAEVEDSSCFSVGGDKAVKFLGMYHHMQSENDVIEELYSLLSVLERGNAESSKRTRLALRKRILDHARHYESFFGVEHPVKKRKLFRQQKDA